MIGNLISEFCLNGNQVFLLSISILVQFVAMEYKGHMKPLGSHLPPSDGVTMIGMFPEPRVFFENFVKPGKPLLLRKALDSIEFPAFQKWTDNFLR